MNRILHYGTCAVWSTNNADDCDCLTNNTWRIRKESAEVFPWQIWRRMNDDTYEPLMRCSSFEHARQLVMEFQNLGRSTADDRNADV